MQAVGRCQSCGMPMGEDHGQCGTHADGSTCTDYCGICFNDGHFSEEMSMEQMAAFCAPHVVQNNPDISEDEARTLMDGLLPTLKRWKKD